MSDEAGGKGGGRNCVGTMGGEGDLSGGGGIKITFYFSKYLSPPSINNDNPVYVNNNKMFYQVTGI